MIGFIESYIDPSLFTYHLEDVVADLFVYVDDIVVTRSNDREVGVFIEKLSSEFPMRDLGNLKFFLGI